MEITKHYLCNRKPKRKQALLGSNLPAIGLTRYTVTIARAEASILPRPLVCYWQRAMAQKTHPHKMVIFLKKNTKKFAFSVRKPI